MRDGSNAQIFARLLKASEAELGQSRADLAQSRAEAAKMKVWIVTAGLTHQNLRVREAT